MPTPERREHAARIATMKFTILGLIALGFATWSVDYSSCRRQIPVRTAVKEIAADQAAFQEGLARLESATDKAGASENAAVVDPETGQTLYLTRTQMLNWVHDKLRAESADLKVPDCLDVFPSH